MTPKGYKQSPEQIRKRMEGSKKSWFKKGHQNSQEILDTMSKRMSGENNPMFGVVVEKNRIRMKENNPMKNPETAKKVSKYKKTLVGDKSSNWKGGIRKNGGGYITLLKPEHPRQQKGYVFEHHLVVEKKIGRYLKSKEVVHHINGIKNDNRIENLMLFENNTEHLKFHIKLKKFPYLTNPMRREIEIRKVINLQSESEIFPINKQETYPLPIIVVNTKDFKFEDFKL